MAFCGVPAMKQTASTFPTLFYLITPVLWSLSILQMRTWRLGKMRWIAQGPGLVMAESGCKRVSEAVLCTVEIFWRLVIRVGSLVFLLVQQLSGLWKGSFSLGSITGPPREACAGSLWTPLACLPSVELRQLSWDWQESGGQACCVGFAGLCSVTWPVSVFQN